MKSVILRSTIAGLIGSLLAFYPVNPARADADDKSAEPPTQSAVSRNENGEMVITVDAATQKRIKLEIANPAVAVWKPEVKGFGTVLDPTPLATAVVDLATARLNARASAREYDRTKTLAAQDNASSRVLEAAQAAAERDQLALAALQAKLTGDWGPALAARDDLSDFARQLAARKDSLVRVTLPAGARLTDPPVNTTLTVFPQDHDLVPAELIEANLGVDPQTQGQMFLFLVKDHALPLNAAVTARLGLNGQPLDGVVVPAAGVLRHEGLGWVYLQTAEDKFTRHQIPLDRLAENGWFVLDGLSATNRVVISGAATVLSAELSGGGFNTGERD